ncbi:DUF1853 family protein [Crenobacter intestini]|uniref:DUF1853 family protein n=1 Tax=Crenobacter intestini TaxID=2563443 RepID=A0A4T0UTB7_9NEIS|nr:DUF1853 family protein [Crenobacter intestini]TIC82098.1 DUF1853 family protein [Crenobacter intestini]
MRSDRTITAAEPLRRAPQAVRDLAWLLGSRAPFPFSPQLPRERLLTPGWQDALLALSQDSAPLEAWLAARPGRRLGHYAEALFGFWCAHAPGVALVAHGLAVRDCAAHTVGEFDFLLRLAGEPWHVELACKFYLEVEPGHLLGPALNDSWALKSAKLLSQLALSRHPAARALLPEGFAGCQAAAWLAGWRFVPAARWQSAHADGWFAAIGKPWPALAGADGWLHLAHACWLSPACAAEAPVSEAALRARLAAITRPQLVAQLREVDGVWLECARGFVLPAGWLDRAMREGGG